MGNESANIFNKEDAIYVSSPEMSLIKISGLKLIIRMPSEMGKQNARKIKHENEVTAISAFNCFLATNSAAYFLAAAIKPTSAYEKKMTIDEQKAYIPNIVGLLVN